MMRTKSFYIDMLDRNPTATIGASLAAKMVLAAKFGYWRGDAESERPVIRNLLDRYGETLSGEEVRREMDTVVPMQDQSNSTRDGRDNCDWHDPNG